MRPANPGSPSGRPASPGPNQQLGEAVEEVLRWLASTPEEAAAALGINVGTLNAMRQGIVPMRSLVIRFAEGIGRRCVGQNGAPEWWGNIDAWLERAGYQPRRDASAAPGTRPRPGAPLPEPPPERPPRPPQPPPGAPVDPDEPLAREVYRPVYERVPWGQTFVHVFWLVDGEGRKLFRRHLGAQVDYKAEAARLKQDLATLSRSQFDRKYGRFRVTES